MRYDSAVLLATFVLGLSSLHAQSALPPQHDFHGHRGGYAWGIEVRPLGGLPFSGKDTMVWTHPTEGGSTTSYLESSVVRDSEGRLYQEHHKFGAQGADPKSTLTGTIVLDPVAHTRTMCNYVEKRCVVMGYLLHAAAMRMPPAGGHDFSERGRHGMTRESLGDKIIDGLPVTGTLMSHTIPAGTAGNEQALTRSMESWYSADLKTNLAVTRKDPYEGTQVMHLSVLSRSDPDPSVFAVPAGFSVRDLRRSEAPAN